jgi:hypothetical protein
MNSNYLGYLGYSLFLCFFRLFRLLAGQEQSEMGKGGGQDWGCAVCTFINESTAVRCEMCTTPSPGPNANTDAANGTVGGQSPDLTYLRPVANDEDDDHDHLTSHHQGSPRDSCSGHDRQTSNGAHTRLKL